MKEPSVCEEYQLHFDFLRLIDFLSILLELQKNVCYIINNARKNV